MEQPRTQPSTTYQALGISSLVLGIIAFIFSFIPCLGIYALFPGILGIIAGVIGFIMANKVNGAKGVVIAGLILSLLGTAVAYFQYGKLKKAAHELEKVLKDSTIGKDFENSVDSSLKVLDSTINALDSLK